MLLSVVLGTGGEKELTSNTTIQLYWCDGDNNGIEMEQNRINRQILVTVLAVIYNHLKH